MPVYDFECTDPKCGCRFRVYYGWKTADGINYLDDPDMQNCIECDQKAEQLYSLTVMRPDTHWNGVYFENTDYYSTSKSQYDKWCKEHWEGDFLKHYVEIGDRTDRESLTKICNEAGVAKQKKQEKVLEQFLIEEYAGVDLHQDNCSTIKEKRKKEQKRKEAESAHPEDVYIDPAFI